MTMAMKTKERKWRVWSVLTIIVMTIVMFFSVSLYAFADGDPDKELKDGVQSEFTGQGSQGGKTYEKSGGGYYAGSDLFEQDSTGKYDVSEEKFNELTSSAQSDFVEDFATACNKVDASSKNVTDQTVDNWWKQLQKKQGMGSKFLSTILADTKPDFVTARKWYAPFSGPIGTMLAFGSIIAMSLIGLVIVADILYITIPPIRLFVDDQGSDGKVAISKIFSHAAISAVKQVEEGGGDGKNKHSLAIYLKSRIVELVVLGICLLYLVQGEIYVVVGWVLDLLSGITS